MGDYDRRRRSTKVTNDRRDQNKVKQMPMVIDLLIEYQNVRTHNRFLIERCNVILNGKVDKNEL